jgi:hypothetical protein
VDQNEAIVAVLSFAIGAATLLSLIGMWLRARRSVPASALQSVESRLARVEVALDDVTAELGRMTDAQQLVAKSLADRQMLPLP